MPTAVEFATAIETDLQRVLTDQQKADLELVIQYHPYLDSRRERYQWLRRAIKTSGWPIVVGLVRDAQHHKALIEKRQALAAQRQAVIAEIEAFVASFE